MNSLYDDIEKINETAVMIRISKELDRSTHQKVKTITAVLEEATFDWLVEVVPSYTCVMVYINPLLIEKSLESPLDYIINKLKEYLIGVDLDKASEGRLVHIPVVYGGEFGPDLERVANAHALSVDEVIALHSERMYTVYMIGFTPGFPYLGELNMKLMTPRSDRPRLEIPAGSVAIGGKQTGIYPIESPGGWHIIGRTPIRLFNPDEKNVSLLNIGDRIQFEPITKRQFFIMQEGKYDL